MKKKFAEERKILDRNLKEIAEIFPSFLSYVYDWEFDIRENDIGGCFGHVHKNPYSGRIKVTGFPELFKMKDGKIKFFILHEILHVYSRHFERAKKHAKDMSIFLPKAGIQPSLWNVAQDLTINYTIEHYLNHKKIELIDGILRVEMFPKPICDDIAGKDCEFIFDYLKKEYEKDTEKFKEMMEKIAKQIMDEIKENGGKIPEKYLNGDPNVPHIKINMGFDDHTTMNETEAESNNGLKDNCEFIGSSHAGDAFGKHIQHMYIKHQKHIKVEKILGDIRSKIISNSSSVISGIDRQYRYHNRRYGSMGKKMIVKGERFIKYQKYLYIALDTSGSVSDNDIKMAITIINKFLKDFHFTLTFIQADNQIQSTARVNKPMVNVEILGRCGTDYQPVFDWVDHDISQKAINKKNAILCYIGDGETDFNINNHGIESIWLLTQSYNSSFYTNVKFGKKHLIPNLIEE